MAPAKWRLRPVRSVNETRRAPRAGHARGDSPDRRRRRRPAVVLRAGGRRAALPAGAGAAGPGRAGSRRLTPKRATTPKGLPLSRDRARTARKVAGSAGTPVTLGVFDSAVAPTRRSRGRSRRAGVCLTFTPGGGPRHKGRKRSAEDDQGPADRRRRPVQQNARAGDHCRERVAERPSKDRMVSSRSAEWRQQAHCPRVA